MTPAPLPMGDLFVQLGVGGIFAVLVIREAGTIIRYALTKDKGEKPVHKHCIECLHMLNSLVKHLDEQTRVLSTIHTTITTHEDRACMRDERAHESANALHSRLDKLLSRLSNGRDAF